MKALLKIITLSLITVTTVGCSPQPPEKQTLPGETAPAQEETTPQEQETKKGETNSTDFVKFSETFIFTIHQDLELSEAIHTPNEILYESPGVPYGTIPLASVVHKKGDKYGSARIYDNTNFFEPSAFGFSGDEQEGYNFTITTKNAGSTTYSIWIEAYDPETFEKLVQFSDSIQKNYISNER